ncbi:MAG: murein L,D-transpeptidase family protein [Vulcanimicrobiota bacterium]
MFCRIYKICVRIREKVLHLCSGKGKVIRSFPVICGRNSKEGTKQCEGDQRTPRGNYYICTINEKSQFTLFFGLSYPNPEDAARGLKENLISDEEYKEIITSWKNRQRPPWNTPLGGEIGIHGGGINRDGTQGCIGMKDEDILELKHCLKKGTNVEIIY